VAARAAFASDAGWLEAIRRVAAAARELEGVPLALQVRIEAPVGEADLLAVRALEQVRGPAGTNPPLFLNAPGVDALALGYDGVHWPERRIPAGPAARGARAVGSHAASVHSLGAASRAETAGARFVVFGPVWEPSWKRAPAQGVDSLRDVARACRIPVLAIGGVTPERVALCLHAGASGVAVTSGVFHARDARAALQRYAQALGVIDRD
jgi:thiamine-phosphate diphosphorylase